ncbi:hypothetical protein KY343_04845 [Candidatus Woesearchaeota archaeon]|nr:hypothetical protein [Candidatus Woesearchaeota archaeon]
MGQKSRLKKERKQREEVENSRNVTEKVIRQRKGSWLSWGAYVLSGVLAIGTIVGTAYFILSRNPEPDYSVSESGLEKKVEEIAERPVEKVEESDVSDIITFEQVKANKDNIKYVQKYLDQILQRTETVGVEGWDSLGELVYDPGYKIRGEIVSGDKGRYLDEAGYGNNPTTSRTSIMCTMTGRSRMGKKGLVYINSTVFEFCRSEDELLSGLDNEVFTARAMYKGDAHIKTIKRPNPAIGEMSEALFHLQCEALSFDLQFTYIENGKRKVSDFFLEGSRMSARTLMRKLIKIAESGTVDGEYAKGIITTLARRPTAKYFR